ncbi:DUF4337 domain-containing protein [Sphaerotilus sp.]|uniref:DUF4337 domain-containing protein n=1 Tax=Sphaerotilus sp. TaxID=2093942 RepID=UPI0025E7DA67|nr:DUF4337 domain-containing protein [Sphaerotilus sp.]
MSGNNFHVHGPHDHELEHAAHHGGDASTNSIAVATAVIATVGALFSYMGGATQSNAGLYKNNAAIKKTEASNQWNFYQSKSSKQNLAELGLQLTVGEVKDNFTKEALRYKTEKEDIKVKAEALEKESSDWDHQSDEQLHIHHRWAQATTVLQISIALAAISLLTKQSWLKVGMYVVAGGGVLLGVAAWMHL